MIQIFKSDAPLKNKDNAPTIDNSNALLASLKENPAAKTADSDRLEIRIINTTDKYQEIEIVCGKKRKRVKITKFLPNQLTNDYLYHPLAKGVGATHLKSLKQETSMALLKEKLLNVLAKINLLNQDGKPADGKASAEIDAQKIWDGPQRIAIDQKFLALSAQQKQALFDSESSKRSPYLSTPEKAILVAAINQLRPADNKVDRDVVSCSFAEIPDKDSFKGFIREVIDLISDKEKVVQNFCVNQTQAQKFSPDKNASLFKQVSEIFSEKDEGKRKHKIHALKKFVDQQSTSSIAPTR